MNINEFKKVEYMKTIKTYENKMHLKFETTYPKL